MKTCTLIFACLSALAALTDTCRAKVTSSVNPLTGVREYTASIESYPEVHKQDDTMKCWAASIQMIFAHYKHEVAQAEIVRRIKGINVNQGGFPIEMTQALSSEWTDNKGVSFLSQCRIYDMMSSGAHQFGNDDIAKELSANRPLLYCTSHHAMVLVSMKWIEPIPGQKAPFAATVVDPWPSNPDVRPLTPSEMRPTFAATVSVKPLSNHNMDANEADAPVVHKKKSDKEPVADSLLKTTKKIATLLKQEDYDAIHELFGDDLKGRLSPEMIENTMNQITAKTGAIESIGVAKRKAQGNGLVFGESLCTTENGKLLIQVQFNSEDEIVGLMVYPRQ